MGNSARFGHTEFSFQLFLWELDFAVAYGFFSFSCFSGNWILPLHTVSLVSEKEYDPGAVIYPRNTPYLKIHGIPPTYETFHYPEIVGISLIFLPTKFPFQAKV